MRFDGSGKERVVCAAIVAGLIGIKGGIFSKKTILLCNEGSLKNGKPKEARSGIIKVLSLRFKVRIDGINRRRTRLK